MTEQGNLTSDDVDDVIVNEENVITTVTHDCLACHLERRLTHGIR
jgi:hypothetical protein